MGNGDSIRGIGSDEWVGVVRLWVMLVLKIPRRSDKKRMTAYKKAKLNYEKAKLDDAQSTSAYDESKPTYEKAKLRYVLSKPAYV